MSALYILAHFDDEYCALPLMWKLRAQGVDQRFLFLADYATGRVRDRRFSETRRSLGAVGLDPAGATHLGRGTGAMDGRLFRSLPVLTQVLIAAVAARDPISLIVTPAWEGGHADHDVCAFLAVMLQKRLGGDAELRQFGLYNGKGLPGPLFRAAPLAENGPVERLPLSPGQWARYAAAIRFYPSQWPVWAALWPAMAATHVGRGFGLQRLRPSRVLERPHAGPLLYERRGQASYEAVRSQLASL